MLCGCVGGERVATQVAQEIHGVGAARFDRLGTHGAGALWRRADRGWGGGDLRLHGGLRLGRMENGLVCYSDISLNLN